MREEGRGYEKERIGEKLSRGSEQERVRQREIQSKK
jgi:hypothetical protein